MQVAIAAARRAEGRSGPNPPVGCAIISSDGQLIAVGHTASGGRPHAETEALAMAGIPARWTDEGLSADDLAGHLIILSLGITHKAADPVDYRARMASAIRLVCRTPKLVR